MAYLYHYFIKYHCPPFHPCIADIVTVADYSEEKLQERPISQLETCLQRRPQHVRHAEGTYITYVGC